ncbi:MAG TPA: hypothetical protein VI319_00275, partial [Burkholderiales bacterium]
MTRATLLAALLALALRAGAQVGSPSDAPVDVAALERRLHQVGVLLETSSAAKQVVASGNPQALARREEARRIWADADKAYRAGMMLQASRLLPEASVRMFEAVRMSAPEQVVAPKARSDFDARLESVRSLAAAQKRILKEKPGSPGAAEAAATVDALLAEAEREEQAGRVEPARAALDRAYLVAKAAIGSMRGGDTLVRSLTFASAEEEYRYEIDRNDTHRMLVKVVLAEKRDAG